MAPLLKSMMVGSSKAGLVLLDLLVWIRKRRGMRMLYYFLPRSLRQWALRGLSRRVAVHVRFARNSNWDGPVLARAVAKESFDRIHQGIGVNLFGFFRGEFGLGESARMYARALIAAGVPVVLHNVDLDLPHSWNDHSLDPWISDSSPYPVSIFFVNPDYFQVALERLGPKRMEGHYLIASWFWELERIPENWISTVNQVDEIMVASHFVEQAFRRVTDKPVLRVPLPLAVVPDSGLQRADFGLQEGVFVFLSTFDFNSWLARKNPFAVIDAFVQAFPPKRTDVRLVLKSSNGFRYPEMLRQLLSAAGVDSRIIVRDEVIDRAHVAALYRCCDAYVSLHRAEGFGLGLAECMAIGKPVIATNWSGNLEFMNSDNSCLVDYEMVPVGEGEYPHHEDAYWASASISGAAGAMRRLADDPVAAVALGARGRKTVMSTLAPERCAAIIARRLEQLAGILKEEVVN